MTKLRILKKANKAYNLITEGGSLKRYYDSKGNPSNTHGDDVALLIVNIINDMFDNKMSERENLSVIYQVLETIGKDVLNIAEAIAPY